MSDTSRNFSESWQRIESSSGKLQLELFLNLAAHVIDETDAGRLSLREAGRALAPAWDLAAARDSSDLTIVAFNARDLSSWGYVDLDEPEQIWNEIETTLKRYLY